jgi:hypothetical protein
MIIKILLLAALVGSIAAGAHPGWADMVKRKSS